MFAAFSPQCYCPAHSYRPSMKALSQPILHLIRNFAGRIKSCRLIAERLILEVPEVKTVAVAPVGPNSMNTPRACILRNRNRP